MGEAPAVGAMQDVQETEGAVGPTAVELGAQHEPLGKTLAKGVVAGVAATTAMVAARQAFWHAQSDEVRAREERMREGQEVTPLQRPVRQAADALHIPLGPEGERKVGRALAWGLGIGGVAAYAAVRQRVPQVAAAGGVAFGLAMWAAEDELLVPAVTGQLEPTKYPWQAHARGLAAHLVYGVTAEAALSAMDPRP